MAEFGLTGTGFVPRTTLEVREQINGEIQSAFGTDFDVSDEAPAGVLIGIMAALYGELWEVQEALASNTDPDAVTGTQQESIAAITGTIRRNALPSTVIMTLTGVPATPIVVGFTGTTENTSVNFEFLGDPVGVDTELAAVAAWQTSTGYTLGDRVTNNDRVYQAITSGTSAASGGPTTQDLSIPDGPNTLIWTWVGDGTAAVDVPGTATTTGPITAIPRTVTVPFTPVGGLQHVTNLLDASPGRNLESEGDLRVRRQVELAGAGASTNPNLAALLRKLDGVEAVRVFSNLTNTTDVDGVPPHAIEALVQGGNDQEIVDLLGEQVVTGIVTFGTSSGVHLDSEGFENTISYSRPAEILVYVRVSLTKLAVGYAGDAAAKASIINYGVQEQVIGKDAVPSSIGASVLPVKVDGKIVAGTAGVVKVTETLAFTDVISAPSAWATATAYSATPGARSVVTNGGRTYICVTSGTSAGSGGPTGTGTDITDNTAHWYFLGNDIAISPRQIARLDTSRTTIVAVNGVP